MTQPRKPPKSYGPQLASIVLVFASAFSIGREVGRRSANVVPCCETCPCVCDLCQLRKAEAPTTAGD